eukprot:403358441
MSLLDKYPNLDRVTILSFAFLLIFIAFDSADNLAAKAMKDDGFDSLGFYSMSVLYFVFALGSFFSTAIVNKIGYKYTLFGGSLTYFVRQLCFILPAYYGEYPSARNQSILMTQNFIYAVVLVSSLINGLGCGILWTSEGKFVSSCATDETKGFFFGYFYLIFMSSQVFGNLIAALVLGSGGQTLYFSIMAVLAFLATFMFLFLKKPLTKQQIALRLAKNNSAEIQLYQPQSTLNLSEQNQKNEDEGNGFWEDTRQTFNLLISKRMRKVIVFMMWSAFSQSTFTGSFVNLISLTMKDKGWSDNKQLAMSLYAMIPLGIGEIIGSLLMGKIMDIYGQKKGIIVCGINLIIAMILVFAYIIHYQFGALTFIFPFFWGLQDSGINNILNCTLGFEFDSKSIPFSVSNFVQPLFLFLFMIAQSYLETTTDFYIYFSVCFCYGILALSVLYTFDFKSISKSARRNSQLHPKQSQQSIPYQRVQNQTLDITSDTS